MCGGQVWVEDAFDLHSELHVFESVGGMGDINSYWVGQVKGPNMEKMDKEIKIHKTKVLREMPLPTLWVLLAWLVHKSVPFPG